MAKGHSFLWRAPGRRDEERRKFTALMRKLEAARIRCGLSKTELAAELGANVDRGSRLEGQPSIRSRLFLTGQKGYILAVPDDEQLRGEDFMNELDRRIQALTPEDMLDTSEEDAQTEENFRQADRLLQAELNDADERQG